MPGVVLDETAVSFKPAHQTVIYIEWQCQMSYWYN